MLMFYLWVMSHFWNSQQYLGMKLTETGSGLSVTDIREGSTADRNGIQIGDRLLKIQGENVTNIHYYRKLEKDLYRNQTIQFTFQQQEGEFTASFNPKIHFPWLQTISVLIIVCVYLGIGILSLLKRSKDPRVRLLFMLTVFASTTVIIPEYYANQPGGMDFWILNFLLCMAYGTLIGVEPHLALVIPGKKKFIKKHPGSIKSFYILGGVIIALSYLRYLNSCFHFSLLPEISKTIFFLFVATYQLLIPLLLFGILLHTFFRTAVGVKQIQTKIVLSGIFPWMVSMVLSALFNLITGQLPHFLYLLNLICIIPVPFAFLIAIFKYRLFDVELVIRKSMVYGLLTGFLFLVYYGTIGVGSGLFSLIFDNVKSLWTVAFATLLLGLLFNPLRKRTQWYVDKFFYPEKFILRRRLPELSKEVASSSTLQELVSQILDKLSQLLHMQNAVFLLADETRKKFSVIKTGGNLASQNLEREIIFSADEPVMAEIANNKKPVALQEIYRQMEIRSHPKLEKLNADIILPFHLQENLVAVLFLGGEEEKGKLSREDRDLIAIFCNQVAAMIENARLFQTATYDDLTGLYRRHVFERVLLREIERSRRFKHSLVVAMIDIDHFKKVNDSYGHASGDILLKNIAFLISQNIRNIDCLARYGGEEFVLLLPETDIKSGTVISEKLRKIVGKNSFNLREGESLCRVTISIGLTHWQGAGKGGNVEDLLAAADRALYQAKARGRNRVEALPSS